MSAVLLWGDYIALVVYFILVIGFGFWVLIYFYNLKNRLV